MGRQRKSREVLLQLLFQAEAAGAFDPHQMLQELSKSHEHLKTQKEDVKKRACDLFIQIMGKKEELDQWIGSVSQKTFTIGIDVDSIYLDGAPIGQNQPHYTVDNFELLNNIFVDDASSRGLTFNSGISSLEEKTMLFGQDSLIRNEPNESMNGNFNVIRYDSVTSVPEPSTLALGSIALALAYSIRRKR